MQTVRQQEPNCARPRAVAVLGAVSALTHQPRPIDHAMALRIINQDFNDKATGDFVNARSVFAVLPNARREAQQQLRGSLGQGEFDFHAAHVTHEVDNWQLRK